MAQTEVFIDLEFQCDDIFIFEEHVDQVVQSDEMTHCGKFERLNLDQVDQSESLSQVVLLAALFESHHEQLSVEIQTSVIENC